MYSLGITGMVPLEEVEWKCIERINSIKTVVFYCCRFHFDCRSDSCSNQCTVLNSFAGWLSKFKFRK